MVMTLGWASIFAEYKFVYDDPEMKRLLEKSVYKNREFMDAYAKSVIAEINDEATLEKIAKDED